MIALMLPGLEWETETNDGAPDHDATIQAVALRFAPTRLGIGLTLDELLEAARDGLRNGLASGVDGSDSRALAGWAEREVRRAIPPRHAGLVGEALKRFRGRGVEDDDLEQEGFLGLIRAARDYDPDLGWRWSTYATWWVRSMMQSAVVAHGGLIHVPRGTLQLLARVELGDVDPATLTPGARDRLDRARAARAAAWDVDRAREEIGVIVEDEVEGESEGEDKGHDGRDARPDPTVTLLLDALRPAHREAVTLRFGIGGVGPLTLAEIGRRSRCSKEMIRQRLKQADATMREAAARVGLATRLEVVG